MNRFIHNELSIHFSTEAHPVEIKALAQGKYRSVNPDPVKEGERTGKSSTWRGTGRFERRFLASKEVMERLEYLQADRGMDARDAVRYLMTLGLDA